MLSAEALIAQRSSQLHIFTNTNEIEETILQCEVHAHILFIHCVALKLCRSTRKTNLKLCRKKWNHIWCLCGVCSAAVFFSVRRRTERKRSKILSGKMEDFERKLRFQRSMNSIRWFCVYIYVLHARKMSNRNTYHINYSIWTLLTFYFR